MAKWPENPRLISTDVPRLDGLAKARGAAKYPSDVRPEGLLFGMMVYSPHARAKIKSIDPAAIEKMPGVKAVLVLKDKGKDVFYQGDEIAALCAETEELARDAARAYVAKAEFEVLPHVVTEEQALAEGAPTPFAGGKNTREGRAVTKGDPDKAMGESDVTIEGTYSVPVITHVCLETHGLTAKWEGEDKLTAWASTQAVRATADSLAQNLNVPTSNVTVLTEVMGGGFGSKFTADAWGVAAARLAKAAGRPVRMFLDRVHEHLAAGNRPSATGKLKLGAKKDGMLTAMIAESHGTGGQGGSQFPLPYVYNVPASRRGHTDVFVNGGGARAMRAPGHPQGCAIMEAAMDDLADKLGLDPLEFRLKNLDDADFKTAIYKAEVAIGAERIGWNRRKPRGQSGDGPIKRGLGMALHTWGGGGARGNQVTCTINNDGSVELRTGTQDIGTGARTILAIIVAEVLGLEVKDVQSNIGNSTFPPGQGSGGSTTSPSMAPPCYLAAIAARDELFNRVAKSLNEEPAALSLKGGQLLVRNEPVMSFKDACRKIGMMPIAERGEIKTGVNAEGANLSSSGVGGCQFAEVTVDVETGVVRVKKIVAVQDTGLILDMLTWKSQVYGGVIGGLNYGLFEERVMDPTTGIMLNPDMELYKLAGASDIPEIIVEAYHTPEMRARGVIGVGEPPTISTAAAIGNAVTNAIGVRVPAWPMSPKNVMGALAKKES